MNTEEPITAQPKRTRLLTAEDVAQQCNLPRATVYEYARTGLLPCVRFGRKIRFDPERIRAFIEGGGQAFDGGWRKEPEAA